MNALWPCHSSTPKSVSKLSVIVYHGIFQSIRAFRRSMSFCGARGVRERGVAGVQMGEVRDLIGTERAAAAGVLGPAEHARLKESAVDDQLTTAFEQVEQAHLTLGPVELVRLLHRHPRHAPTLGGQRITRASQGLLLHEETLARNLPFLLRHDWRCVHSEMSFTVLHIFRLVPVHVSLL